MTIEQFIKGMKTADNSAYTLKDLISKLALAIKDDTSIKHKVSNILDMDDSVLDALKVGDVVQKKTNDMEHCYIVTYKEEKHGICLTYFDAGYAETVSYDYSTDHWVYNSTDITNIVDVTKAPSGSIQDCLGLDSNGDLVKGVISGGTKLYKHVISFTTPANKYLYVYSTSSTQPTAEVDLANLIGSSLSSRFGGNREREAGLVVYSFASADDKVKLVYGGNQTLPIQEVSVVGMTDTVTEL